MIDFDQFVQHYGSLTRGEFLDVITTPHLLLAEFSVQEGTFRTARLSRQELLEGGGEAPGRSYVLPLKKREGANAFLSMVTFGRAGNNDIVLKHDRLSALHGYFREVGGEWFVCDSTSQNGTSVDGRAVTPGDTSGARLDSGSHLSLGARVELTFFLPADLHAHCQRGLGGR